jgi:hypothetical protein
MDVIDTLVQVEKDLERWIFAVTPTTDAERDSVTEAMAKRDEIHRRIDDLGLKRLQLSTAGLADQLAALQKLSQQISGEAKTIDTAKSVLGTAAQVIGVAATVAGAL